MNPYNLIITPRRNGIPAGRATELDVLVRLQAPQSPPDDAPRRQHDLNIACVIDRSGSMSGQPLEEAKRCVLNMIERLKPTDCAACIVYDDKVRILVPSRSAGDSLIFRTALAGLQSGGTTDLHGGWLAGAQEIFGNLRDDEIARVILLSDGQANAGVTDASTIASQCEELANLGVTTSTYGLGCDFNEDLMIAMARRGGGNHYYGETAADLLDPFQEEFDLLQDLCARHVRLRISPAPGVRVRVLNDYPSASREVWRLPDLAFGSEGWALARLEVSSEASGNPLVEGRLHLGDLEFELVNTRTRERRFLGGTLAVPAVTDDRLKWLPEDELLASRARELESAALQIRIREAVRAGDWELAERLLAQAELDTADHPWLREMVRTVRRHLSQRDSSQLLKETAYSSARLQRRLAASDDAEASSFDPATEGGKRSYLRRKSRQGRGANDSSPPDRDL